MYQSFLCGAPGLRCALITLLLLVWSVGARAATLEVGPGRAFDRLEAAVAAARPGDEIRVHPPPGGGAYERVAVLVDKPRLSIRAAGVGAGERVTLSGRGFVHSGRGRTPRAIVQFDPAANDGVLAGFELTGASNATDNGAGVRINQANRVSIRDCDVHHNDIGIMSNGNGTLGSAAAQLIEHTAIHDNGDDRLPAFNHNLYLGGTSATLRFCEVRGARTGHNLKSRLHVLRVEYSYIHASVNRELDLVDAAETAAPGSDVVLLGNVIVKSRTEPGNRGVIHFGQDGGRAHKGTLYLVHNTIVTPFVSPVVDLSSAGADAVLLGNIIDDGGRLRPNQVLGDGRRGGASATRITGRRNRLAPGFASRLGDTGLSAADNEIAEQSQALFVAPQQHDYRPRRPGPGIAAAGDARLLADLPQTPGAAPGPPPLSREYGHPLLERVRSVSRRPDLGAHAVVDR
jgi:hypothetical protein